MGRSRVKDPFEIWTRSVRRAIRDHVRDRGEVPSLMAAFSTGANPRALRANTALHLMPDAHAVAERIADDLRRFESRFGAIGQLKPHPDPVEHEQGWHLLLITTFTLDRVDSWAALVHPLEGVRGWDAAEFRRGDVEPFRMVIAENAARTAL